MVIVNALKAKTNGRIQFSVLFDWLSKREKRKHTNACIASLAVPELNAALALHLLLELEDAIEQGLSSGRAPCLKTKAVSCIHSNCNIDMV